MSETLSPLAETPCCPALDCPHEELVAYIRSMKGGERVMDMGGSGMTGMKGTVEIKDERILIRWDHREYADCAGVMVTSFTGGARIIQDNAASDLSMPAGGASESKSERGAGMD